MHGTSVPTGSAKELCDSIFNRTLVENTIFQGYSTISGWKCEVYRKNFLQLTNLVL